MSALEAGPAGLSVYDGARKVEGSVDEAFDEGARGAGVGFDDDEAVDEAFLGFGAAAAGFVEDEGVAVLGATATTLGEAGASGWRKTAGETPEWATGGG